MAAPDSPAAKPAAPPAPEIADLSLEELLNVRVTSVSRQVSTVGQSPAAIFVITSEMISRSGARTIMDTLRMVPGLNVARGNGDGWAISARGFNNGLANKLLVQVDGRSVYTPVYSGVYWDTVDYPLEDIERVEVIRGPGASVWGANAVNGIINVITKRAKDTQGTLLQAGTGNQENVFGTLRYGGKTKGWDYRVYAKGLDRDREFSAGGNAQDAWQHKRGGFRMDSESSGRDQFTVQGDYYGSEAEVLNTKPTLTAPFSFTNFDQENTHGGNLLGRWSRELGEGKGWELQTYYDTMARRDDNRYLDFKANTFDIDFQHRMPLAEHQKFIYGLGYRRVDFRMRNSVVDNGLWLTFPKGRTTTHLFSAFAQDEIELKKDRLALTVGSKIEHNSFTGVEVQPTTRLLWTPNSRQSGWLAASRAVRTPSFLERDLTATLATGPFGPGTLILPLTGNPDFDSERLMAYELGFRSDISKQASVDTAVFFNDYNRLSTVDLGTPVLGTIPGTVVVPIYTTNKMKGNTYGVEVAANWRPAEKWRLYGAYSFLKMNLHPEANISPIFLPTADNGEGQSPRHQFYVRSSWDLPANMQLDVSGRYISRLDGFTPVVKSYTALDARLAWKSKGGMELALVGQNLLDSRHQEFGGNPFSVEIRRSVFGQVTYRW